MTTPQFDAEGLFTDDYLYFFADHLEERSDAETDLIWRLLELQPGMEVLDLACGHGRIANRLAGRGCRVTGLDSTELFLDHARRDAAERGVSVEYVRGDMRELPWRDRFDAIVNWFTAFGYFDDPGNQRVLAQAAAALRPGGRIALEMSNYLRLLRDYLPSVVVERDGDLVIDQHHLDPLAGRSLSTRTYLARQVTAGPLFGAHVRLPRAAGLAAGGGLRRGRRVRRRRAAADRGKPLDDGCRAHMRLWNGTACA